MYLLILDYETDAERKRIDYAIERWQDELFIKKPKGAIIIVKGKKEKVDEFIEDLCARLERSEEKVEVYEIKEYRPEVEKNTRKLSYETRENVDFVKRFIDYLMTKLNASYEYGSKIGKVYKVYTKKGQATLEIVIQDKENGTVVKIAVEGYGDVVDFVSDKIDNEMKTFLGGG
ncbi:MAG TPA: hypothetical protein ENI52_01630 [Thermoplasmata archaeon]|nr:hypothetical protein [Thermoplasmata archaeon]